MWNVPPKEHCMQIRNGRQNGSRWCWVSALCTLHRYGSDTDSHSEDERKEEPQENRRASITQLITSFIMPGQTLVYRPPPRISVYFSASEFDCYKSRVSCLYCFRCWLTNVRKIQAAVKCTTVKFAGFAFYFNAMKQTPHCIYSSLSCLCVPAVFSISCCVRKCLRHFSHSLPS